MKFIFSCVCLAAIAKTALPAPANGFVFPDDRRRDKKLEPIITPPVLPILEHLERDPSTLLPNEVRSRSPSNVRPNTVKPRFGGGFNVRPQNGGLTASVSSSGSFGGASQSASQSFSFGFNEGFSASHSASQASSFNGFGSFSGSQASSQAASFGGSTGSLSGAASSSSALAGGGFGGPTGSQSASSAFEFNSHNGFPQGDGGFNDPVFDVRHRGVPNFPFPSFVGRGKGVSASAFKSGKFPSQGNRDDFYAVLVSN